MESQSRGQRCTSDVAKPVCLPAVFSCIMSKLTFMEYLESVLKKRVSSFHRFYDQRQSKKYGVVGKPAALLFPSLNLSSSIIASLFVLI